MGKYIEQLQIHIHNTKKHETCGEKYRFSFNYETWKKQDFIDMMTDLQDLGILKCVDCLFTVDIHHCQLNYPPLNIDELN